MTMLSAPLNHTLPEILDWNVADFATQTQWLTRPLQHEAPALQRQVMTIIEDIRQSGDTALLTYTERFDGVRLSTPQMTLKQIETQANRLAMPLRRAIDQAYQNIYHFHQAQQPQAINVETMPGVRCEQRFTPINRIGLYVPGGSASLPSTVLMGGVPAQIAQCPQRILISPPSTDGLLSPAICYAALKCGFTGVYRAGGAQAIAAMAFGTVTIPSVDKIFGPGNRYVTAAKQHVSQLPGGPAIDLPAGPSELMVIADDSAEPDFIAADLLSQAEHGSDSQVILLSPSRRLLKAVRQRLAEQLLSLPRASIASDALTTSRLILTNDVTEAIHIAQRYAPEHLSLQLAQAEHWAGKCTAGSVFIGHYSPESAGDYATGTNHILPTYGYARTYNSLGLIDFYRRYTVQHLTAQGLQSLAPTISALAHEEALTAHQRAVSLRLSSQRMQNDLRGRAK